MPRMQRIREQLNSKILYTNIFISVICVLCRAIAIMCSPIILNCFVQDQITEDLFPGEEEEESSADDLTPSVTSNTSDLLRRLQGKAHRHLFTHDRMTF